MYPKSIQSEMTIFNIYENFDGLLEFQKTSIRGVFWQGNYGANLTAKGVNTTDRIAVFILKDIEIPNREYLPSYDFLRLPKEQKSLYWTISKGDKLINKIISEEDIKVNELEKKLGLDNVFTVTNYMFNDFGSKRMRHFKIIGR